MPQPSSDPNDPLLWPQWKKIVVFCNICTFAFLGNANIGGLSPGFRQIAEEFDLTPARASQLITTTIVVLGCSVRAFPIQRLFLMNLSCITGTLS